VKEDTERDVKLPTTLTEKERVTNRTEEEVENEKAVRTA
jgi:hypothetical protein